MNLLVPYDCPTSALNYRLTLHSNIITLCNALVIVMPSATATFFRELSPDLFPVIIGHLPLVYRPSALLSLALTCHHLHNVVFPRLVYADVRLVGEDQGLSTLNALIAKAELVTEEDIQKRGNPSPSHCIHNLCLDFLIKTQDLIPSHSINRLQKLIDIGGLRHLSTLTLQITGNWVGTSTNHPMDGFLNLPSSFGRSLKTNCPNLKAIHLSYFSRELEKERIEPDIFASEVNITFLHIISRLT